MIEGRGNVCETVLISPRPFSTRLALPVIIRPMARRVLQTLIGSKLAFNTNTGTYIGSSATLRIIARDIQVEKEGEADYFYAILN